MDKAPLILFALLIGFFAVPLLQNKDPARIDSAMIGRPVPLFDLGDFSSRDLTGEVSVVNIFASWCLECQIEQGMLESIGEAENVPVYGLAYKDTPESLALWLEKFGDPYDAIGEDRDGKVAIDWGVYGVPETFVVDAAGVIRYRHVGVVTGEDYQRILKPLLAELRP